jgi:hypothetical protein
MPIKTITQIRAETPTVTLTDADLFLLDQTSKTVAATLAQLKTFVRPANATTTTGGLMSSADKTKLGQIPANATANQTDGYLLDRANHTGTQSIATVTDLQTELNKKLETVTINTVVGLTDALADKADAADIPDVSDLTTRVDDAETAITGLTSNKLDKNNPAPTGAFAFPKYTFAGKPSATSNNGRYIEITDSADGIVLARSNGTDWVKVAVVSADPVTAAP